MRSAASRRSLLLTVVALLCPLVAEAQSVLSVQPLFVSVTATAGTNAASTTVQVTNSGRGALKWTVVQSTDGWVSVSPTKGTNSGTLTLTFQTAAKPANTYQTTFRVEGAGTVKTVTVEAVIVAGNPPPPPTLTVTCPANMTVSSPDGSPVIVNYSASSSGGVPPVTVTGVPASGTSFSVGTTPVQVTAQSSDGQTANCTFSVTVTAPPPDDWTFCASENQFCAFSGTTQVRYGANGTYAFRTLTDGTPCTNAVFGDPIPGVVKQCHIAGAAPPPPPRRQRQVWARSRRSRAPLMLFKYFPGSPFKRRSMGQHRGRLSVCGPACIS